MEKTIKEIIDIFKKIEGLKTYALIGGLAVGGWVMPRATKDIDLLVNFSELTRSSIEDRFLKILKDAGFTGVLQQGELEDDISFCIKAVSMEGIPVNIIFVTKKWEEDIAADSVLIEILEGAFLPVVSIEGLIILKLKAGSFQDIADASRLLMETDYDREKMLAIAKQARIDKNLKRLIEKLGLT